MKLMNISYLLLFYKKQKKKKSLLDYCKIKGRVRICSFMLSIKLKSVIRDFTNKLQEDICFM